MAPRAVLMKTGLKPLNTARPVNTAHPKTTVYSARPMSCFSKSVQSTEKSPYQTKTVLTSKNLFQKVNTAKGKLYTARPKAVNTARLNTTVTSKHLMEDMLHLGEEPNEEELLLTDESQVLLKVPRKNNMYSVDMKNIVPKECLTCLDNLVRGLPSKRFENDQTCVACLKGKQYKVSCKSKIQNSISQPLFMLHMDLFGPTFVSSLMNKKYCLVVTDDYSRFTWVFFLASKDKTSGILKSFITQIENIVDKKVKIIRCDNGTEFKNRVMSEFCEKKGIKKEFSVARTPQQNGIAERRNRTLIKDAKTMLADSKLPTTFWDEAVNTACYV
ncbi:putative ribonuclease H-like domain-containing protein [Tanacetum coccineum]